ncbi:hypothetical protein KAR91_48235 [Candidatus Pacearchaeota archaeon]|nr:hypothetical protein [Candidatus Pacearchaeota archaeon]
MPEALEFNHEGLPHNIAQSDILATMTREQIEEMIQDPSQNFKGLDKYECQKETDGLTERTEEEMIISEGENDDTDDKLD